RRSVFLLFFFFQAEDGIRDGHVTGVQTCALPISLAICLPEDQVATLDEMLEQMEILIDHSLVKRLSLEEPPREENTELRFHFLEIGRASCRERVFISVVYV